MDVFKPFCGYTYFNRFKKQNNFSRFVCPYNFEVYSKEKFDSFIKNEHNVFNFKEEKDGQSKLQNWVQTNVLVPFKTPSFYIYEMSYKIAGEVYKLTGIVGALKLPEEGEEFIYSCEETLEEEVNHNFDFLKNSGFLSSPVCALCDGQFNDKALKLIKEKMSFSYMFKAKQNNVVHKLWKIDEEEILNVLVDFFKDKVYYIISGSEKYESAIKYRNFLREKKQDLDLNFRNYVMALMFLRSDFSFTALPMHRLISGINMFDGEEILKKASNCFDIIPCKSLDFMRTVLFNCRRNKKHAFGIYADGCYSVLTLKEDKISDFLPSKISSQEKFDVFIVDDLFLKKILGFCNVDVKYCSIDWAASNAVDCGDACFAIYLSAMRSEEFFDILELKSKFPKKSFSFFPKPVEGLLFYVME